MTPAIAAMVTAVVGVLGTLCDLKKAAPKLHALSEQMGADLGALN